MVGRTVSVISPFYSLLPGRLLLHGGGSVCLANLGGSCQHSGGLWHPMGSFPRPTWIVFILSYIFRATKYFRIGALKRVFAKNKRGYRLNATKKRFWSLLILLQFTIILSDHTFFRLELFSFYFKVLYIILFEFWATSCCKFLIEIFFSVFF